MDASEGGDGPTDDASLACRTFASLPAPLLEGDSYTRYGEFSAYWSGDVYALREGTPTKVAMGFLHPRLSFDGNEILMINSTKGLYRTIWNGSEWTTPSAVATELLVEPGTIALGAPRVMFVSSGGRLYRGVEESEAWFFSEIGTLGLAQVLAPSIDPTGTRLVFVGTDNANAKAIYITIADAGSATGWSQPELLYDHSGDETTPFLTADCTQLTYSVAGVTYILQ